MATNLGLNEKASRLTDYLASPAQLQSAHRGVAVWRWGPHSRLRRHGSGRAPSRVGFFLTSGGFTSAGKNFRSCVSHRTGFQRSTRAGY